MIRKGLMSHFEVPWRQRSSSVLWDCHRKDTFQSYNWLYSGQQTFCGKCIWTRWNSNSVEKRCYIYYFLFSGPSTTSGNYTMKDSRQVKGTFVISAYFLFQLEIVFNSHKNSAFIILGRNHHKLNLNISFYTAKLHQKNKYEVNTAFWGTFLSFLKLNSKPWYKATLHINLFLLRPLRSFMLKFHFKHNYSQYYMYIWNSGLYHGLKMDIIYSVNGINEIA